MSKTNVLPTTQEACIKDALSAHENVRITETEKAYKANFTGSLTGDEINDLMAVGFATVRRSGPGLVVVCEKIGG